MQLSVFYEGKKSGILFLLFFLLALNLSISLAHAQQKKELTNEQILKHGVPHVTKTLPSFEWLDDAHYLIQYQVPEDEQKGAFIVDARTGSKDSANEEALKKYQTPEGKTVTEKQNDLYLEENGNETRLTFDSLEEVNATLSPDGSQAAFTVKNNLYAIDFATKKITQLTSDGSEVIMNGYLSWVYMEEILGRPTHYKAFWWSPDSKTIAFFHTDDSPVPVFPIYNSEGMRGSLVNTRYPQPGDANPQVKMGFVSSSGGNITWADFDEKDHYFGIPQWSSDGKSFFQPWENRDQNNLKIFSIDPSSGKKKEVYDEKQKYWIDLDLENRMTQLSDHSGFFLLSDKSGWLHWYMYDMNGKFRNAVTFGLFNVEEIVYVDEKKKILFFTAFKESSTRADLYSVQFNGQNLKRLTFGKYYHSVEASADGSYFMTKYSNHADAGGIAIIDRNGKATTIYDAKNPAMNEYNLPSTDIFTVKSDDKFFDLPVSIVYPLNFDPMKKYPVLINVYGGPGVKNVSDYYALSAKSIWWAKEGIIQVTMDHRASGHFGKKGIENMYHDLGDWEMKDYITVVKSLEAKGFVDTSKVCITGFSYGGYVTCLALTKGAKYFTHGIAGGSVVDWTLYDNIYTERYMGTPATNPSGYKSGSVLTYVDNYRGKLLLVHGATDDNVHAQNTLQLAKALQDRKMDFEMMLYPEGKHGWAGNQWTHFDNLKTEFIYKYLLEKSIPQGVLR